MSTGDAIALVIASGLALIVLGDLLSIVRWHRARRAANALAKSIGHRDGGPTTTPGAEVSVHEARAANPQASDRPRSGA